MSLFKLVFRHLWGRPLRTLLSIGSLVVAFFLLCALQSLITTLSAGAEAADARRLVVQSAVSLFVDLPLNYQGKIEQVEGVEETCKWQWFGGYYQEPGEYFAQFAVDPPEWLRMYPEFAFIEGSPEAFLKNRRGCVIGEDLRDSFGWKVGDTVPLIGGIFPHPGGADKAWEFQVEGVYRPTKKQVDKRTFFFHWDYFEKTLEAADTGAPGTGMIVLKLAEGTDPTAIMATVDGMYENGPQRVQTTTEDEFNKQFVSMLGNLPFFLSSIGGAILVAILLACVNTMLMAGREQTRDVGIMKALGFTDAKMFGVSIAQSLLLCLIGGGLGVLLAKSSEGAVGGAIGAFFPGYAVRPETIQLGLLVALAVGVVAGLVPALRASRLSPVEAFRSE